MEDQNQNDVSSKKPKRTLSVIVCFILLIVTVPVAYQFRTEIMHLLSGGGSQEAAPGEDMETDDRFPNNISQTEESQQERKKVNYETIQSYLHSHSDVQAGFQLVSTDGNIDNGHLIVNIYESSHFSLEKYYSFLVQLFEQLEPKLNQGFGRATVRLFIDRESKNVNDEGELILSLDREIFQKYFFQDVDPNNFPHIQLKLNNNVVEAFHLIPREEQSHYALLTVKEAREVLLQTFGEDSRTFGYNGLINIDQEWCYSFSTDEQEHIIVRTTSGNAYRQNRNNYFRIVKAMPTKIVGGMKEITVRNAAEFITAVDSNTVVKLKQGEYDFNFDFEDSFTEMPYNPHMRERTISHVENLTIIGEGEVPINIITDDLGASALEIDNSKNVTLKNLNLGHTESASEACTGAVMGISKSSNIHIENCTLFGCGIIGITFHDVQNMRLVNSCIKECSQGIMQMRNCSNLLFQNSSFINNSGGVRTDHCVNIVYESCVFVGKEAISGFEDVLLYVYLSSEGTLWEYLSKYRNGAVHIDEFTDHMSNITTRDVFLSVQQYVNSFEYYKEYLQHVFAESFDGFSIESGKDYTDEEVNNTFAFSIKVDQNKFTYRDAFEALKQLQGIRKLISEDSTIKTAKMEVNARDIIVNIKIDTLYGIIENGSHEEFLQKAEIVLLNPELKVEKFFMDSSTMLSGNQAKDKLLTQIKVQEKIPDDGKYYAWPRYEYIKYDGCKKNRHEVYHYFKHYRQLPLEGDYVHHDVIAQYRVNALTGEIREFK